MNRLRKYIIIARVSLTNAIAYKASTFSRFAFYTLFIYVFMSLWRAIYREGGVHGYGYGQIVWYLIATEFIAFACGTGITDTMNEDVKSGAIAYHTGRPVHYLFYQFASAAGQIMFNAVCFGALAVTLGLLFVGPLATFKIMGLPAFALSVSLSVVINFSILSLIRLSAFVMEDNFALFLIYQKLNFMLGLFLPVEFLPAWLQPVAKNLPFSYIYWAPAKIFVDYSHTLALELIARQAAWATAMAAAAFFCYRIGVRRLQINGG